jgi:DNA-binding PadR family transcriptional regulator
MYSKELIKGTLKTIILKLLAENDRMYGYEITRHVRELTDGELVLTEGALYPTLHKLEKEGFLVTEKESIGKRVRKYYSLTPSGNEASLDKLREFQEFVQMMQLILNPKKINPARRVL